MPFYPINFALAKAVLERDRPDADPDAIDQMSLLAGFVPGTAGLVLPIAIEDSLPSKQPAPTPTPTPIPVVPPPTGGATGGTGNGIPAAVEARFGAVDQQMVQQGQRLDTIEGTLRNVESGVTAIKSALESIQAMQPGVAGGTLPTPGTAVKSR